MGSEIDKQINDVLKEIGEIDDSAPTYHTAMSIDDIKACGKKKDANATQTLIQIIENNTYDPEKTSITAWAIGQIGDYRALPALISTLPKVEDPAVREKIIWAMGKIKNPRVFGILVKILKDAEETFEVKWAAALAMKSIGKDAEVAPLIEALKKMMLDKAKGL